MDHTKVQPGVAIAEVYLSAYAADTEFKNKQLTATIWVSKDKGVWSACVYVCVYTFSDAHVEARGLCRAPASMTLDLPLGDRVSHWPWSWKVQLAAPGIPLFTQPPALGLLMWVLRLQTQVLMLQQQPLHWPGLLPGPWICFLVNTIQTKSYKIHREDVV